MQRIGGQLSSLRWLCMALVFLVMSCEDDGDGDGCLGDTDALIVGCSDGCGTGMTPIGDGCMGSCLFGGDGDGCGTCAGEGCDMDCGDCGDCGDVDDYTYGGDVVEGAVQIHVTSSLFEFVETQLLDLIEVAAEDILDFDSYCQRCADDDEDYDCDACDRWFGHCLEPISADAGLFTAHICNRGENCNVSGDPNGADDGCWVHLKMGEPELRADKIASDHGRAEVYLPIEDINGPLPSSVGGNCTIHVGKHGDQEFSARVGIDLIRNPFDRNTEVYIGKPSVARNGLNIGGDCALLNIASGLGILDSVIDGIIDGIGAISCRGCDSDADCGGGNTSCQNGTCRDGSGRMCQGIQLGADVKLDAGGLLQSIDPGAEAQLGVRAFLGSYVDTLNDGLQLAARLGGDADPQNLCVPMRPSPAQSTDSCRDGKFCPPLAELNDSNLVRNPSTGEDEEFHLGAGISMSGLNQVLWSAYSSGLLCLSISGEADGLEMLSTSLVSLFVQSLGNLTYGEDQPLMIQLRPQYPPEVDFKEDQGQGAELDVIIPELHLDFYTIVDQRYMRIFTLQVDVKLPLGLHVANNTLDIAIGDLTEAIDPESVKVHNIEMVQPSQVQSLANNIPTLIGSVSGLLGDELIPPIDIPDIEGIELQVVGPGTTMLEEDGQPAALGVFFRLGFSAEDLGGLRGQLEPDIAHAHIDQKDPRDLRQEIVARNVANQSFGYQDLMPEVRLQMRTTGASEDDIEYAYRINGGPWSFWKHGPELHVDHPILAMEDRFDIEVTARIRGDGRTGSKRNARVELINDYTAPSITLRAQDGRVFADVKDNVYNPEELTMQVRFDEGAWQDAPIGEAIPVREHMKEGAVAVQVRVEDPSGNARTVGRTFGEKQAPKSPAAASVATNGDGAGCATSTPQSGWLAALAMLLTLWLRRRRPVVDARAASPYYVALSVLALLLLSLSTSACVDNAKELRGAGSPCDPACAENEICNDGVCEEASLCTSNDDCDYGHICKDQTCMPSECSDSSECEHLSCDDGYMPFCDYDDYPSVEAGECICSDGAPMREYGSWLNMFELSDGSVVAFAYHTYYGDLIRGDLDADDAFEWVFIDGVPDGPVVLPPAGRRGGVRAPGDDAGNYVSAAHEVRGDQDIVHLAYQYISDEDATSRLRYARGTYQAEDWTWEFIDITDEFVPGLFAHITLVPGEEVDPDDDDNDEVEGGGIVIFYMTADAELEAENDNPASYYSELSAAYTDTRDPQDAEDFVLTTGLDQAINDVPCGGFCAKNSLCVDETNTCASKGAGCDSCDEDAGEACVLVDGAAQCAATSSSEGPAFETIPHGMGLFSSALVDDAGDVHVAYYDQYHGLLKYQRLAIEDGSIVQTDGDMILDGEIDGVSTGDAGRWTRILPHENDLVVFYEDAGRAELRAARVSGGNVEITVLDDGYYQNDDDTHVSSNRVGTSIDVTPREDGGFDVYYQDGTDASVRHLIWEDLNDVPEAHPYAVFGSRASIGRDVLDYENASNRPEIAIASETGAYGLFTQVLQLDDTTLFASKQVRNTSGIQMDVRAARLRDEGAGDVSDGEGGEGGDEPVLECASPGSYAKINGTANPCLQCEEHNDGTYWSERYAPKDFYRCVAHHDSSDLNAGDCDNWAFYSDSNCDSANGIDFRLDDYGTNHMCARANWEADDDKTRDTTNSSYWEKVGDPTSLIVPQWPEDFASMTHQNDEPNRYRNTIETRRWLFDRAFRYLGQLNGEPGSGDSGGRTYYTGWDASGVYLEPGQSEWFAFYYNDRKNWLDRIGVLTQFDDEHMEVEVELSFVCGNDGGGGRPRLDGIRFCGAEGDGQNGDKRADMNVRCGETGDVSTTQRENGSGDLRTRYASCIGDTAVAHNELPWTHEENAPKPDIEPADWGQVRGGIYMEGHLDCGTHPGSDSGSRSGWAFVRVTRKDAGDDARHDVCTPIVVRPTWHHHQATQGYDECW